MSARSAFLRARDIVHRNKRPDTPADEIARLAAFPKPQFAKQPEGQMDTRELQLPKIHPQRDEAYRRYLRLQPCSVAGLTDSETGKVHECWHPSSVRINGRFLSDNCHTGKAYSGNLKRDDAGQFSLCRAASDQQELNMDRFDARFGINRHEITARQHAAYLAERDKRS